MARLIDYIAAGALGLGAITGCGKEEPPAAPQTIDRIVELTKDNFQQSALKPHLAVVRIYEYGNPNSSASIKPYRDYANDFAGRVTFGSVDNDEEFGKKLAKDYAVKTFPAFLFYMDGKHQGTLQGWPGQDEWLMKMMETFHHECCKPQ